MADPALPPSTPQLPAAPQAPDRLWRLGLFGGLIGLLTTLSIGAGTTATLIGLLFALIGGTFMAWIRPEQVLSALQQELLLRYTWTFSLGLLVGLAAGFGLRFLDQAVLQPEIFNAQQRLTDGKFHPASEDSKDGAKSGDGGAVSSPVLLHGWTASFAEQFAKLSNEVADNITDKTLAGPLRKLAEVLLKNKEKKEFTKGPDQDELIAAVKQVHKHQNAYAQKNPEWGRDYAEFLYRMVFADNSGR